MNTVKHFSSDQIEALVQATRDNTAAGKAMDKAKEKREGAYTVSTRLALELGSDFEPAMEHLFSEIRTNQDKRAVAFKAQKNDKGDGYKIPSSLSTAKSVLAKSVELGVDMTDDETGEPLPFGTIRKAKKAAEQALADAERDDATIARDTLVDRLTEFAAALKDRDVDNALGEWCEGMADVLTDLETDVAALMGDDGAENIDEEIAAELAAQEVAAVA